MKQLTIILLTLLFTNISVIGQEAEPSGSSNNWGIGIKAVQQINYPISHSIIAFNLTRRNHSIYAGPNYSHLFNNYFGDEPVNVYEKNSIGINFGY